MYLPKPIPLEECYAIFLYLTMNPVEHDMLCKRIEPFLSLVNDGGYLASLYVQLKQSYGNEVLINGITLRLIEVAKTNPTLDIVIRILHKQSM